MHNGAFVRLEDAIRHHLDPVASAASYSPARLGADLRGPTGPAAPVLQRLDARLVTPTTLSDEEFSALVGFVRDGLLDRSAEAQRLRRLIPERLPSGRPPLRFEFRAESR